MVRTRCLAHVGLWAAASLHLAAAPVGLPIAAAQARPTEPSPSRSQTVSAYRLQEVARAALQQRLAQAGLQTAHVRPVTPARDLMVPAGPVTIRALAPVHPPASSGRTTVWLDVTAGSGDSAVVRRVAVPLHVDLPATVPAREPVVIAKNEGDRALPQAPGQPLVVRGDWVQLRVQDGSVRLERRARALDDGALGERVRVRATTSDEAVAARVIGAGQVQAEATP